jgi:hypothetical protein
MAETLESRKIKLAQNILGNITEEMILKVEQILATESLLKEEMEKRALQSEEDIKSGKIYDIKSAKDRIKNHISR